MNILLLGSGGREHAFAWKLRQSPLCTNLFIAPGNTGTALCGINKDFGVTDFAKIKDCCVEEYIDMVIVGPEEPLVKGVVDFLHEESGLNLLIIGPSKDAAQLEGSKAFAKGFMHQHAIPTAPYKEFTADNFDEGIAYLKQHPLPVVLKADGLAAGKGVLICQNHLEAISEFELMIQRSKFGDAGKRVVIEQFLDGIELSIFVLTDGKDYVLLPEAKDYKRIGEGDKGANTGGMGAISPVPFADEAFMQKIISRIVEPTIQGLQKNELKYKGFIFIGVIKVGNDPFVIEYNCRMGDPEAQTVLPRIKNDLVEVLASTAKGEVAGLIIQNDVRFASTIVAVSGGYPAEYEKDLPINGLKEFKNSDDSMVFHSGTREVDGAIVTSGGRVFSATSLSSQLDDALEASRESVDQIQYENKYYRRDIGYEFIKDLA
ncbi:MAG: phosphoribosylamine--glycine ligase [Chitinophagaceae bacterium]